MLLRWQFRRFQDIFHGKAMRVSAETLNRVAGWVWVVGYGLLVGE